MQGLDQQGLIARVTKYVGFYSGQDGGGGCVEKRLRDKCGSCETIGAIAIVEARMAVAGTRVVVAEMKTMVGTDNIC